MISTSVSNSVRHRRCLATQHAAAVVAAACVALGLAVSVASAQTNVFATYVGSDGQDSITSLETDASGAVYIAGGMPFDATSLWASTFTAFGQGPAGSPQCYFAKLTPDANGNLTYAYTAVIRDGFGCGV